MNKALLVVGYHWLRCRVSALINPTLHEVRGRDAEDTMEIRDLEEYKFVDDMYTQQYGGLEVGEHAGRQIREILRRVFLKYGLEPQWETATNSQGRYFRIPEPRVFFNGRSRRLPEPTTGKIPAHEVVKKRAEIRQKYVSGQSDDRELPPTYLEQYPWQYVLARSNRPDYDQPELVQLFLSPLCSENRILADEVSTLARPVKLTEHDHPTLSAEKHKPTVPEVPALTDEPTIDISTANKGTLVVTKIFATSRQSRTPAMQRLGPKVRTASEPATRSRSSPRPSHDQSRKHEGDKQEEEKGEPTKASRKRAALRDDLSADKSSEECEVDLSEVAANKSLEDEDVVVDMEPDVQIDSTDEEEARDFRQLLADLTEKFEKQQAARREQRAKKKMRAKQGKK